MGKMTLIDTPIDGLFLLKPQVFEDKRGYFMEVYNQQDYEDMGLHYNFVQDNQSKSSKGVMRGLHFQKTFPQAKLVRVLSGEVFDVAVDLRKESPTYGKWYGVTLSAENKLQMLIPRGFAHGFMVLSEEAEFTYKCDEFYHPEDEGGIRYNDPTIGIEWPKMEHVIISDKDLALPLFEEIKFIF